MLVGKLFTIYKSKSNELAKRREENKNENA